MLPGIQQRRQPEGQLASVPGIGNT